MSEETITVESTGTVTATADKWYSALDADTQGYITSRGLADKDPVQAFLDTAKAHKEAQAYIGVPKEQLLKLPKSDAPPEEWDSVYERLGYSKNADDYKLEGLKHADGTDVDDAMKDFIRAQASDLKLSPSAAQKLAENTIKQLDTTKAASTAEAASWSGLLPASIAFSTRSPSTACIRTNGRPSTTGSGDVATMAGTGNPCACSAAMILA